ncbi:hypothetical protein AWW67_09145 [Roseivirga seohaensis]|uniref:Uncharacterized protein n=1 Tax=Roseivirga seohaensis TaxID=1914963 RepID=A0A150XNN9_9BACT|nr:hypothetical protein [Roseivirga seohaensis]KYG80336.1 hypothetical protein AWW67_09145 [Roseivirga seohaensis]
MALKLSQDELPPNFENWFSFYVCLASLDDEVSFNLYFQKDGKHYMGEYHMSSVAKLALEEIIQNKLTAQQLDEIIGRLKFTDTGLSNSLGNTLKYLYDTERSIERNLAQFEFSRSDMFKVMNNINEQ